MPTLSAEPQFTLYAICSAILSLQMLLLAGMTAAKRSKVKQHLNPEDVKVSFQGTTLVESGAPSCTRWARSPCWGSW